MTDTRDITVPAAQSAAVPAVPTRRGEVAAMTLTEALTFADAVKSAQGMIPKAYLNEPAKILACVLAGQELGVGPMAALRAFHIVEGKPCADYTFWIARLKSAGYRVQWLHRSDEKVSLRLIARDGTTHDETWDKARAIKAGLWNSKDNWKKYPQTMLSARCVTSAGRAFAGEVMFGCHEEDEIEELRARAAGAAVQLAPSTTVAERVAEATGTEVSEEAVDVEAKQRALGARLKALQLSREQVLEIFDALQLNANRVTQLDAGQVDEVMAYLDREREPGEDDDLEDEREPDPDTAAEEAAGA